MTRELDLIAGMLERTAERVDQMTAGLGELSAHVATLVERTGHLATREDVSTAIATHAGACKASRAPRSGENGGIPPRTWGRVIKALAALLATAGAALAAYLGIAD